MLPRKDCVGASMCSRGERQGPRCGGTGMGLQFLGPGAGGIDKSGARKVQGNRDCLGRDSSTKTQLPTWLQVET